MFKKEAVIILASLLFLLGAGCQNNYSSIADCEKISDESAKTECADNFYYNEGLCDSIFDKELKNECSGIEEPVSGGVESPFESNSAGLESGDIPPKPEQK